MKKLLLTCFIAVVTATAFSQNSAQYERVVKLMKNKGWTQTDVNRWADLKEGGYTSWWSRHFYSALEYAVVALSDDPDVEDVDVEVRDMDDNLIAKDDDEDDVATARFTLDDAQSLKIKMTNYSSETPSYASRCRYLIFYK